MRTFGLIGNPLTHSFSKKYFEEKFVQLGITDASYDLFELNSLENFNQLLTDKLPVGLFSFRISVYVISAGVC